jgi:hypothetical protein
MSFTVRRTVCALSCCAALAAGLLAVSPGRARPAVPPTVPSACSRGRFSAISEIACELRGALARAPAGALVVAAPPSSEAKLTHPNELAERVASVVAGGLDHPARRSAEVAGLARARSLAAQAGTLIYLRIAVLRGQLTVSADVYPVPKNFWDRVRDPEPNPTLHAFASRRIDAEVRSFLAPVPLVASRIDRARVPDSSVVALACGDARGDGALELLLVSRHDVELGRVRHGAFVTEATARWSTLSPVAPRPLREPIAAAWFDSAGRIDVGLSDRADAVRFGSDLEPLEKLPGVIFWPGGGCAGRTELAIAGYAAPCTAASAGPEPAGAHLAQSADAIAGSWIADRAGRTRLVRAARVAGSATAVLADSAGRVARVGGVGAELAVADLDEDGQPELISGTNTLDPKQDALVVDTWLTSGPVVERLRVPVPDGVRALAVCPPEDEGIRPIAIATNSGVWIVH